MSGKRQKLKRQLFTKNRLVVLNEDTFEEIFSLKLTLMNVFVVLTVSSISLFAITTYIIAFTPLREYIPGYASSKLKRDAIELAVKSDSLSVEVQKNDAYLASIKKILIGDLDYAKLNKDSILSSNVVDASKLNVKPSEEEIKLRDEVALEDKYNLFEKAESKVSMVLFSPAKGHIIEKFSSKNRNFAVKVVIAKDAPIKSIANGTVIFAEWTPNSGYVIILKHKDGIISVYKKLASLTKSQGDVVKTSEVIALAGPSGSDKKGIYLHFELWKDGYPIDPTQFIEFE